MNPLLSFREAGTGMLEALMPGMDRVTSSTPKGMLHGREKRTSFGSHAHPTSQNASTTSASAEHRRWSTARRAMPGERAVAALCRSWCDHAVLRILRKTLRPTGGRRKAGFQYCTMRLLTALSEGYEWMIKIGKRSGAPKRFQISAQCLTWSHR